jgi:hypothetical protein
MITRSKREFASHLTSCSADALGRADLAGWILARDLTRQADRSRLPHFIPYAYRNAFSRLESITLGTWDDGRWATYYQKASDEFWGHEPEDSGSDTSQDIQKSTTTGRRMSYTNRQAFARRERMVCPRSAIDHVLETLFHGSRSPICIDGRALLGMNCSFESPLTVIHNSTFSTDFLNGRTRLYASTSFLQEGDVEDFPVGNLRLDYDGETKPVFRLPRNHLDRDSDLDSDPESAALWARIKRVCPSDSAAVNASLRRKDIEICLVPSTKETRHSFS